MNEERNDKEDFDIVSDSYSFSAKGKEYAVVVMPLAYAKEYMSEEMPLFTPKNNDYSQVLFNFMGITRDGKNVDMLTELGKWVPRLLKYQGKPCTIELLMSHEWDIVDLGKFLKKAVGVSG